ncbi:hypothetical protein N7466_003997 [Penicillium verhagenii]|uniref:uncharacterized protein n=1 Tax=Penicillium verhagenii TaxID=1562060 RepID=UPI0025455629|nr:uncharacterized protein N7466_003997 [Penicillium verhagenii]KAJ5934450.1 hypothetical protein N7466_003997 [Penicillium verhagenii]
MGDALRPGDDVFSQVLQDSLKTWTSYLPTENKHLLPQQAINMRPLVSQTPPFLGGGIALSDETISFACEEKKSEQGEGSLVVNGRSAWRTSDGNCDLPPRVLPKQLLLAVGCRLNVELSEDSALFDWPGVQGLSGYDKGNYLSVLYFAWAYILSARWVELLGRSGDHECHMSYALNRMEGSLPDSDSYPMVEIDIGDDAYEEELLWWRAILCSNDGWDATVKYKGQVYLSPWSISLKNGRFALATKKFLGAKAEAPSSNTALKYLCRFCVHHRLYAQCSVALAGVLYIPFLSGRTLSLPLLRQASRLELTQCVLPASIPDLLIEHTEMLPKYMTLSSNPWGLRSLLHSTFFNPVIECNLVSAWLNPAFAIIDSIAPRKIEFELAVFLANRSPLLGPLWLGAILTDLAKTVLRDIRAGMVALDLPASAWATTTQTFLTCNMGTSNGESIRRDDECRLSFITACKGHDRPPVWPWKPFGSTNLCDTDLMIRQHTQCSHFLEYESWEWILVNGHSIRDFGKDNTIPLDQATHLSTSIKHATLSDYNYDFSSQLVSEGATRGIFGWLRSTGYPRCEKPLYQHSWIDLENTEEEEEPDDAGSDAEKHWSSKKTHVESWLDGIE